MDRLNETALFLAVVDHGSFSAAARAIGQTPSAVGKRIRLLEERLGVDLLTRSTRRMALTDAGRRYAEDAREILSRLEALEEDITAGTGQLRGTVRLTSPIAYGQRFVVPAVTEFMHRHPQVEIELSLTDRKIDLVAEGVDLAVRTGIVADSGLIGRRLGPYRRSICAAPDYIAAHGTPRTPGDLGSHRCLRLPTEKMPIAWGLEVSAHKGLRLGPSLVCNSLDALHDACCAGLGLACLPEFMAGKSIAAGHLVPLLQAHHDPAADGAILILRPETSVVTRRLRALVDHLVAHLRPAPG